MEMSDQASVGCAGCGVTRRQFVERSTLAAVAAFLAACSAGSDITGSSGGTPSPVTIKVSDYPALANAGGIVKVNADGIPVAVVHETSGSFAAFSMVCPHQGTTINISGSGFVCPNHGARFNALGQWTGGQSTSNLRGVAISYDQTAGTLTVG